LDGKSKALLKEVNWQTVLLGLCARSGFMYRLMQLATQRKHVKLYEWKNMVDEYTPLSTVCLRAGKMGVFLRYDQAILKCCSKEQNITKANYSRKALTKGERILYT